MIVLRFFFLSIQILFFLSIYFYDQGDNQERKKIYNGIIICKRNDFIRGKEEEEEGKIR